MTWRRFGILLRGLSGQSATATTLASREPARRERVVMLTEPSAVQAYFDAKWGRVH